MKKQRRAIEKEGGKGKNLLEIEVEKTKERNRERRRKTKGQLPAMLVTCF